MAEDIENLKKKYEDKIQKEFKDKLKPEDFQEDALQSSEYLSFKKENQPKEFGLYEQACQFAEKIAPISPDPKKIPQMEEDIATCHMNVSPKGVMGLSIVAPLAFIIVSTVIIMTLFVISGKSPDESYLLIFIMILLGAVMMLPLQSLPTFLAQVYRMRASNQMILSVFYIVTFMRHTSNLERAIGFASQHISPPLSLDFKKIIWDVETKKYDTVYESVEAYLKKWQDYNPEFVESMHVIIGSLYESSEDKRQELLDKSLDLILQETYDKMLHYAHNLQSPITALHMLGIVLPILGLIILPLMVNFIPEIEWYYIMLFYNIILPAIIFYMGRKILAKRPSGYGGVELNMKNPEIARLANAPAEFLGIKISPKKLMWALIIGCTIIGFSPILMNMMGMTDFGFSMAGKQPPPNISPCDEQFCFLGYSTSKADSTVEIGPFGLGATLISLFFPLAFCLGVGLYFKYKSDKLVKMREETSKLEAEFVGALFQLGNRLGDGIPPEMAFDRVARSMPNSRAGDFFRLISTNISKLGMSVNQAIFDEQSGALIYYPSTLIESSMKILTQSAQKGPAVASNAISNVARYIKEMDRVNERLQDLMAEVIASMKSQIGFLTPIISGIVIGITSMITAILQQLGGTLGQLESQSSAADAAGGVGGLLSMFGDGIPTYFFQLIVGIYVVQVVYLLSTLINSIQNGVDPINEMNIVGKNMLKSAGLYILVAGGVMLMFNIIASSILTNFT